MTTAGESLVAIAVSSVAVVAWLAVLILQIRDRDDDQRRLSLMMPITALTASIGTLASAIGFAQQVGALDIHISQEVLTLIASMGRGALAAAGIIVLTERPSAQHRTDVRKAGDRV